MRRVLVIGCGGAGKSTFSRKLAAATGLPLVSLDAEFWRPGWVEPSIPEWRDRVRVLAAADAWIMDGSYRGTLDLRLPRADTLVWLDYPRRTCLARVLWRIATSYGQERPGMAPGCPERLDLGFFHYVWTFDRLYRPRMASAIARFGAHLAPVMFRHDADAVRFLDSLSRPTPPKAP